MIDSTKNISTSWKKTISKIEKQKKGLKVTTNYSIEIGVHNWKKYEIKEIFDNLKTNAIKEKSGHLPFDNLSKELK